MRYLKKDKFTLPTTTKPDKWPPCSERRFVDGTIIMCSHPNGMGHRPPHEFTGRQLQQCPAVRNPGTDETRCIHEDGWGHKNRCVFPDKPSEAA
jgi:hypothetical protein